MLILINLPFSGNRLAIALEAIPEESVIPHLSYNVSPSISCFPRDDTLVCIVAAFLKGD